MQKLLIISYVLIVCSKINKDNPTFVNYYKTECLDCKKTDTAWNQSKTYFKTKDIQFLKVNCDIHNVMCHEENINTFPTFKLFIGKIAHVFTGKIRLEDFNSFLSAYLQNYCNTNDLSTCTEEEKYLISNMKNKKFDVNKSLEHIGNLYKYKNELLLALRKQYKNAKNDDEKTKLQEKFEEIEIDTEKKADFERLQIDIFNKIVKHDEL